MTALYLHVRGYSYERIAVMLKITVAEAQALVFQQRKKSQQPIIK